MSDYLNELETFWNEFAEEYEMIQQESTIPIAEELRDFCWQKISFLARAFWILLEVLDVI